ncbi:PREDICTED: uncharacterized protein LOC108758173 [Trachymyrmex cornetzi]|uniref:uncharacterized protein LOC108758173 n=1 Tax=Trachymyrmex cornetzi TaxID=471704 RepID=UPI00084F0D47|nr:PREDICTED: uncharacterized protein LOC108758173 [Trachymyrmex cornetzi]
MDLNKDQDQSSLLPDRPISWAELNRQVTKMNMELKIKCEQASKLALRCAKEQLELLKLYSPKLLQVIEELKDISASMDSSDRPNDINDIELRDNQVEPQLIKPQVEQQLIIKMTLK